MSLANRTAGPVLRASTVHVFGTSALLAIAACSARTPPSTPPDSGPAIELPPGSKDVAPGPVATSTSPHVFFRSHRAMGSQTTITAYTVDEPRALEAFAAAFREMDRLEGLLSVWKPESDVSRLNASAGVAPVPVAPETFEVLERALAGAEQTGGKFDITFGALSGLWKFDHDQDDRIPPRAEVLARLKLVGSKGVLLDRARQTAFLQRAGMKVHLGGIGKGYAVDRAVAILRAHGLTDFMVQFGGDMFVSGRRGDRAWRVGIRDPRGPPDRYFAATEVTDATFSTSGDYERFFIQGGRRYHHILDLATGEPATACRSVTIMAKDATTAEVLSKGVFVLGPEKGLALVEATDGAAAVIVDRKNQVHVSPRLEGKVRLLSEPTDGI